MISGRLSEVAVSLADLAHQNLSDAPSVIAGGDAKVDCFRAWIIEQFAEHAVGYVVAGFPSAAGVVT